MLQTLRQSFIRARYLPLGIVMAGLAVVALGVALHEQLVPTAWQFTWLVITGSALFVALLYQWVLLIKRIRNDSVHLQRHYQAHRWVGIASIGLFGLHAFGFGYFWTNALAITFCLTALTGMLNREVVRYRTPRAYLVWFGLHLTLSAVMIPLIIGHIWAALVFEGI